MGRNARVGVDAPRSHLQGPELARGRSAVHAAARLGHRWGRRTHVRPDYRSVGANPSVIGNPSRATRKGTGTVGSPRPWPSRRSAAAGPSRGHPTHAVFRRTMALTVDQPLVQHPLDQTLGPAHVDQPRGSGPVDQTSPLVQRDLDQRVGPSRVGRMPRGPGLRTRPTSPAEPPSLGRTSSSSARNSRSAPTRSVGPSAFVTGHIRWTKSVAYRALVPNLVHGPGPRAWSVDLVQSHRWSVGPDQDPDSPWSTRTWTAAAHGTRAMRGPTRWSGPGVIDNRSGPDSARTEPSRADCQLPACRWNSPDVAGSSLAVSIE